LGGLTRVRVRVVTDASMDPESSKHASVFPSRSSTPMVGWMIGLDCVERIWLEGAVSLVLFVPKQEQCCLFHSIGLF
jgi:hypothetical protein